MYDASSRSPTRHWRHPKTLKKIFNQFEQASTSITKQYGGTGLGLTIVKSLVEAQGGELEVDSEPGKGSVFTVELVYERITAAQHHQLQETVLTSIEKFSGKVLVVDDDAMILKLCGLMLSQQNIDHKLYNEAEKLLHEPMDKAVTHVLMDIRMPHINGVDLCRELKKAYENRVTYVALTAHVLPEEQQELLNAGFDQVLSKPFREEELVSLFEPRHHKTIFQLKANPQKSILLCFVPLPSATNNCFKPSFSNSLPIRERDLEKVRMLLPADDLNAIREIIHKLSGRVGQMGASSTSGALHVIEKRIDGGESSKHW